MTEWWEPIVFLNELLICCGAYFKEAQLCTQSGRVYLTGLKGFYMEMLRDTIWVKEYLKLTKITWKVSAVK